MKKVFILSILFLSAGLAFGQINKDKTKPILLKDTLKKEEVILFEKSENTDSLIVAKGKFKLHKQQANASYYADKFNGKRTANGEKFSNSKYTAAHRKFPFGTILKITNESNGKFVIVKVNDRGPFSKGREIDLSKKAFMELATNKNTGVLKVKIEILEQ
jgi:rare lipoprotein A